jgi:hypothetical protein
MCGLGNHEVGAGSIIQGRTVEIITIIETDLVEMGILVVG